MNVNAAAAPAKWSILVYSAADNSLHDYLVQNLEDSEKVGSTDQVKVVSQLDEGGDVGARRLFIKKDPAPGLQSPVVQKLGDVDMASPDTLSNFIQWGMKNYPAEHYMLVISDHGDGWKGAVEDDSAGTWMHLPQIEEGLQEARAATGRKLDVVGFDACLMASAEVARQLKDEADYLVVSQETEGGEGWPYTRILSDRLLEAMRTTTSMRGDMTPRELATFCVRSAAATSGVLPTMAAVDTSKVPALDDAVKQFADAIVATQTKTGEMRKQARHTQSFYEYKDLADFAVRVAGDAKISDAKLKQAASGVADAVGSAVIAEEHSPSYPGAHGLTVQLGSWFFSPNREYRDLKFAPETHWDRALDRLGQYWFWPAPLV